MQRKSSVATEFHSEDEISDDSRLIATPRTKESYEEDGFEDDMEAYSREANTLMQDSGHGCESKRENEAVESDRRRSEALNRVEEHPVKEPPAYSAIEERPANRAIEMSINPVSDHAPSLDIYPQHEALRLVPEAFVPQLSLGADGVDEHFSPVQGVHSSEGSDEPSNIRPKELQLPVHPEHECNEAAFSSEAVLIDLGEMAEDYARLADEVNLYFDPPPLPPSSQAAIDGHIMREQNQAQREAHQFEIEVFVEYCTAVRSGNDDPGSMGGTKSSNLKRVHPLIHRSGSSETPSETTGRGVRGGREGPPVEACIAHTSACIPHTHSGAGEHVATHLGVDPCAQAHNKCKTTCQGGSHGSVCDCGSQRALTRLTQLLSRAGLTGTSLTASLCGARVKSTRSGTMIFETPSSTAATCTPIAYGTRAPAHAGARTHTHSNDVGCTCHIHACSSMAAACIYPIVHLAHAELYQGSGCD